VFRAREVKNKGTGFPFYYLGIVRKVDSGLVTQFPNNWFVSAVCMDTFQKDSVR